MRKLLLSTLLYLFAATTAQADPFVILPSGELAFNTSFATQGGFTCSLCTSGSGTNSVVFGSGANTVTITFVGTNTTILVGADPVPVVAGQIQVVATGTGFVFPVGSNPNVQTLFFTLSLAQSSPINASGALAFSAFGGSTSLTLNTLISDYIALPTGPNPPPFTYTGIAYSFLPIIIPNTSGTVNVVANVSAIPEPVSLLLMGSGLGMMLTRLRRKGRQSWVVGISKTVVKQPNFSGGETLSHSAFAPNHLARSHELAEPCIQTSKNNSARSL